MNLTTWVDVAIGVVLVYLGASLFLTVINEYVAQLLDRRGKNLLESLEQLIDDGDVRTRLAAHPTLAPFFAPDRKGSLPSYVDPTVLARLVIGALKLPDTAEPIATRMAKAVDKLESPALKAQLKAILVTAGEKADDLVKALSESLDRSLTVLGERFKRRTQAWSFFIGLSLAVALNLDTIALTTHLYRDKEARDQAVAVAIQLTERTDSAAFNQCLAQTPQAQAADSSCAHLTGLVTAIRSRNETLGRLPLGWAKDRAGPKAPVGDGGGSKAWFWTVRAAGWVLTALAVSVGAPFWFDLLNKFVNLRHAIRPAAEKKDEKKTG